MKSAPKRVMKCVTTCAGIVGALAAMLCASSPAGAQAFPSRPMRIISTTSPGGVNDTICRAYAAQISQALGQPVVVENRPGAGSIIGMMALARSAPDGYTVAVTTAEPLIYNPLLIRSCRTTRTVISWRCRSFRAGQAAA
jgi:tripartite-type tricarboxylate transporter receptor subunit TctC